MALTKWLMCEGKGISKGNISKYHGTEDAWKSGLCQKKREVGESHTQKPNPKVKVKINKIK